MPSRHDGALCAALGHYIAEVLVIYCPHHQGYETIVRAGDDHSDESWRSDHVTWGPFDQRDDVEQHLVAELRRLLRADLQGWLATQRSGGRGAATE
jgi:hypothetical protein